MKTIIDVEQEVITIRQNFRPGEDDAPARKAKKRLVLLNDVIAYLETNPTAEFVNKERFRLADKLQKIRDGFPDYLANIDSREDMSGYLAKMGGKLIKDQIKVLNYILQS
jgi:hypothetical protein